MAGFYAYLLARDDTSVTRIACAKRPCHASGTGAPRQGVPLVRTAKTLPRILSLGKVDVLVAALRTDRDQAMVQAMVLGGLRRCEVLGLDLGDVRVESAVSLSPRATAAASALSRCRLGFLRPLGAISTGSARRMWRLRGCSWC